MEVKTDDIDRISAVEGHPPVCLNLPSWLACLLLSPLTFIHLFLRFLPFYFQLMFSVLVCCSADGNSLLDTPGAGVASWVAKSKVDIVLKDSGIQMKADLRAWVVQPFAC